MPYTFARLPAKIDKVKEGSFGNASNYTTAVKSLSTLNTSASKPATVKRAITTAKSSSGFSVINSIKVATSLLPNIKSKITKTHT